MTTEEQKKPVVIHSGGGADAVYGIGMIGAWVYYLKRATTNQERGPGPGQGPRLAGVPGLRAAGVPGEEGVAKGVEIVMGIWLIVKGFNRSRKSRNLIAMSTWDTRRAMS